MSSIIMICKNVLDEIHGLQLGFVLKTWTLWKTVKWYELCKTLKFKWIGLWYVDVYTTAFICDLCIHLVEASQRLWFGLWHNMEMKEMR